MLKGDDPKATYTLGEIEAAIGAALRALDESRLASLRGRLRAVQRAGLAIENPGRGKVIRYTLPEAYNLALAVSLCDFGMTPIKVTEYLQPSQGEYITDRVRYHDQLHLVLLPFVISEGQQPSQSLWFTDPDLTIEKLDRHRGRAIVINLTKLCSDMRSALNHQSAPEPKAKSVTGERRPIAKRKAR